MSDFSDASGHKIMLDKLGSSNARKFTAAQANFPNYQALSWNGLEPDLVRRPGPEGRLS